jgi:hypothetical protein
LSCTFPYLVEIASLVTVFVDDFEPADDEGLDEEPEFDGDAVVATIGAVGVFD